MDMIILANLNPNPNLMAIIIYVAFTRNWIASRKINNKVAKELKNKTNSNERRIINILLFMVFPPSLTLSQMTRLLTLGVLITCVLKRLSLKIFISI